MFPLKPKLGLFIFYGTRKVMVVDDGSRILGWRFFFLVEARLTTPPWCCNWSILNGSGSLSYSVFCLNKMQRKQHGTFCILAQLIKIFAPAAALF